MTRNYKALAVLKLLKSSIDIFINSFFVLYFLSISNSNIVALGIYYLIMYSILFFTIFLLRNRCKSKKRINLLRIGILLNLLFFILLFFMQNNIVTYSWFIAIVYGLEEGFYYSVYNNFESSGVENHKRANFIGVYTAIKSILKIIIPVIFGSVISWGGFDKCFVIILFLAGFQLIVSVIFKDKFYKESDIFEFSDFLKLVKANSLVRRLYRVSFFQGMIYSGAFQSITMIYIVRTFMSGFSLGIFTSIFAIVTGVVGMYFAKLITPNYYKPNLKASCIMTLLALGLIIIQCNVITVIVFNLVQSFSKTIVELISENYKISISNLNEIKEKYKAEYFIGMEFSMWGGRLTGYMLFILLALSTSQIWSGGILIIFGIFIILFTNNLIRLQRLISKKHLL
ncbi:MAG: hypothetical protein PWQ10_107 [Patescibacteria group bacterium]|nr:hypothetical protein [Patescibacteria group bacterium]